MKKIAIQMDPLAGLKPAGDSTLALAEEAARRGMGMEYYLPGSLALEPSGALTARLTPLHLQLGQTPWWRDAESHRAALDEYDAVLMRQDPPFDLEYITATYLLERLGPKVFNPPAAVRNAPEKLTPYLFPQFQPPTLVSADKEALRAFLNTHEDAVLKPLHGFGGHGIFRLRKGDANRESLLELLLAGPKPEPLVAQPFLPEVSKRELRIVMIDGRIAAAFRRAPAKGEIRTNMRVGGQPLAVELNAREVEVAEAVGVWLKQQGILLCGLDLIGGWLGEINVTCPTGLRAVETIYGKNLAAEVWDAIETSF